MWKKLQTQEEHAKSLPTRMRDSAPVSLYHLHKELSEERTFEKAFVARSRISDMNRPRYTYIYIYITKAGKVFQPFFPIRLRLNRDFFL